ncbi:hypothetical protein CLV51_10621 [Chitinophaga niastensis]|uniref:Uncharacterized protein n=1 Tax=Chitinophaga niastensis TaxID=536980 RepID=A0A2P8HD49_CHINA|nr:hypothetical protein [Chitinophaga niastensis]PSL44156.1 hypothetical protein CLV51_10621 [Chitinophaga niastensis]
MEPNAIKKAIQICLLIMISQIASAQIKAVDNDESRKFFNKVERAIILHRIEDSVCNEYSTVIIHVRNKRVLDSVDFSRNPKIIKLAFATVFSLYKNANWDKIIRKSSGNFDIIQPFIYTYYPNYIAECPDTISTGQIKAMMDTDIGGRKKKNIPTFLLENLILKKYGTVAKK